MMQNVKNENMFSFFFLTMAWRNPASIMFKQSQKATSIKYSYIGYIGLASSVQAKRLIRACDGATAYLEETPLTHIKDYQHDHF